MGKIRVTTGTMFAGKTTKLITIAENLRLNEGIPYSVYRPKVNIVNGQGAIMTHNNLVMYAKPLQDINTLINDPNKYIFIDSFQNLPPVFVDIIEKLAIDQDKEFYLFGTRTTPYGEFQETACKMMSIADEIEILPSKCSKCGEPATYSVLKPGMKLEDDINKIVGEKYEILCKKCFHSRH